MAIDAQNVERLKNGGGQPVQIKAAFSWAEWLSKQGFTSVLLVAMLLFFRSDVWQPIRANYELQTEMMQEIMELQRAHDVADKVWREYVDRAILQRMQLQPGSEAEDLESGA